MTHCRLEKGESVVAVGSWPKLQGKKVMNLERIPSFQNLHAVQFHLGIMSLLFTCHNVIQGESRNVYMLGVNAF